MQVLFIPGEEIIGLPLFRCCWSDQSCLNLAFFFELWQSPEVSLKIDSSAFFFLIPPILRIQFEYFIQAHFLRSGWWLKDTSVSQMRGDLIQHLLLSHPASSALMGAGNPTSSSPTHQGRHMWASTKAAAFLRCQTQTSISLFLACLLQGCNRSSDYTNQALKCSSLQNLQDTSHPTQLMRQELWERFTGGKKQ